MSIFPVWLDRRTLACQAVVFCGGVPLEVTAFHNSDWFTVLAYTLVLVVTVLTTSWAAKARYHYEEAAHGMEEAQRNYEAGHAAVMQELDGMETAAREIVEDRELYRYWKATH